MRSKELKAYTYMPDSDSDSCVAIICYNSKEAKLMGWKYWEETFGNDYSWVDARVKLNRNKDIDLTGISYGVMDDSEEGLKRNLYGGCEGECPRCSKDNYYYWDSEIKQFYCSDCEGMDICPKCSTYNYDTNCFKCRECDKE